MDVERTGAPSTSRLDVLSSPTHDLLLTTVRPAPRPRSLISADLGNLASGSTHARPQQERGRVIHSSPLGSKLCRVAYSHSHPVRTVEVKLPS